MSKVRYGIPHWLAQFHQKRRPTYPCHRGHIETDVVVVGGGFTGCATAYAFAEAGIRVALFESNQIGQGSTGASTAMLMQEPDVEFQELMHRYGLRAARKVWQMTRRATLDLVMTLRRLNIKCQLEEEDSIYFATDPEAGRRLRREYEARHSAGLQTSWMTGERLYQATNLKGYGALRTRRNAQVDPYRMSLGFAEAAVKRGALIYERSGVRGLRFGPKGVDVKTGVGTVRANSVVIATECLIPTFKSLARHFRIMNTYAVITPPLPAKMRAQLGDRDAMLWDSQQPYHYLRWTRDNRILFGGADQLKPPLRQRDKFLVQRTGQLMYELSTMYPVISGILPEYGWDGLVMNTLDGLPLIGPHRNFPRHLFALGYGGNGLTLGFLASRILVRNYLGESSREDELFGFTRL